MNWDLAALLASGALTIAILALRAARDYTSSYTPVFGALRERFAGVTDQTLTAIWNRVQSAYAAGVSYNRLRSPDSFPTVEPVDLRPALSRRYGAPPPNPMTGTNKQYSYVVDVTLNQLNAIGTDYISFPVTITSPELLSNGELDNRAAEAVSAFVQMLIDEYGREGLNNEASVTGTRVLSSSLGYDFPPGWTV